MDIEYEIDFIKGHIELMRKTSTHTIKALKSLQRCVELDKEAIQRIENKLKELEANLSK